MPAAVAPAAHPHAAAAALAGAVLHVTVPDLDARSLATLAEDVIDDLPWVTFVRPFTKDGYEATGADLDAMVRNFERFRGTYLPPLKLGHGEDQRAERRAAGLDDSGEPALGWLKGLRRAGDMIQGRFERVPRSLLESVQAGRYRQLSGEFWPDGPPDTPAMQGQGLILRAVSVLGAAPPHVKGLGAGDGGQALEPWVRVAAAEATGRVVVAPPEPVALADEAGAPIRLDDHPDPALDRETLRLHLERRAERFGIEVLDDAALTWPADFPTDLDLYGDPVNLKFPTDTPERARNAAARFAQARDTYKKRVSQAVVFTRIVEAELRHGAAPAPDEDLAALLPEALRKKLMPSPSAGVPAGERPMTTPTPPTATPPAQAAETPAAPAGAAPAVKAAEPPAASQPPAMAVTVTGAISAVEGEALRLRIDAVEKENAALRQEAEAARAARRAQAVKALTEDLKRQGRYLPAWDAQGMPAMLVRLAERADREGAVALAEGKPPVSEFAFVEQFLRGLPELVSMQEQVRARTTAAALRVPEGSIPESVELLRLAEERLGEAKAKGREIGMAVALREVAREHPELVG